METDTRRQDFEKREIENYSKTLNKVQTAVVILNWNGRHLLEQFLPSALEHLPDNAELIVADNGSSDDSIAFLMEKYPTVRTIELDRNYGFAEGYNKALQQVEADYYVLLNDDVEVSEGWIERIVCYMESHSDVGIAQPKLLMLTQRDTFEYAGGAGGYIDKLGYPFCRGRIFNTLERDEGQYNDCREIFWASGAAMFVKSNVWKELGGLDGDFFAHMEEIDFCWRAKNKGYSVVCVPDSVVYHKGAGTLAKGSPFKTMLNFRNNLSMLYKNLPEKKRTSTIIVRFILDWVAAFSFLLKGSWGEFTAVFKAHRQFKKNIPLLNTKRAQAGTPMQAKLYDRSILVEYHIRRHRFFRELDNINKI